MMSCHQGQECLLMLALLWKRGSFTRARHLIVFLWAADVRIVSSFILQREEKLQIRLFLAPLRNYRTIYAASAFKSSKLTYKQTANLAYDVPIRAGTKFRKLFCCPKMVFPPGGLANVSLKVPWTQSPSLIKKWRWWNYPSHALQKWSRWGNLSRTSFALLDCLHLNCGGGGGGGF